MTDVVECAPGFRPDQLRVLPAGADLRLSAATLAEAISFDVAAGRAPLFVSVSASVPNSDYVSASAVPACAIRPVLPSRASPSRRLAVSPSHRLEAAAKSQREARVLDTPGTVRRARRRNARRM